MAEYENVEWVWMINVYDHKTDKQGPARLTLHNEDKQKLDDYVSLVRLGCGPSERAHQALFLVAH